LALLQQPIPDSRVFDAEKAGETLTDIKPGLPAPDNFQRWPPWPPLTVETARHVPDHTGGTLVMPMTVLVEQYWRGCCHVAGYVTVQWRIKAWWARGQHLYPGRCHVVGFRGV
jgi:hypothetical protein